MNNPISIEQTIARIEEIVRQLGESSISLDDSLRLYAEGMKLSESCFAQIDTAEQLVEQHSVKEQGG
ncbi:MAG: exodeoxyribonuclease VII small subunit [Angelakisella sp.]